jgi:hypothetical protein
MALKQSAQVIRTTDEEAVDRPLLHEYSLEELANPWFRKPPPRKGETPADRRARVEAALGMFPHPTASDTEDFLDEKHRQIADEFSRYP